VLQGGVDQLPYRPVGLEQRAEVERLAMPGGLAMTRLSRGQRFGREQVAPQWFEHVLSGPGGIGVAHRHGLAGRQRPHRIGHDAVFGPVATTDHVGGAGRGDRQLRALMRRHAAKARPPAGNGQLGRGLAGAVGVVPPRRSLSR